MINCPVTAQLICAFFCIILCKKSRFSHDTTHVLTSLVLSFSTPTVFNNSSSNLTVLQRFNSCTQGKKVDWLPSSNTCLVKHAYLYIAFNLLMAEHKKGGKCYKKYVLVIGHDIIDKYRIEHTMRASLAKNV